MNTTWTILTGRYGSDVRDPRKDDLHYALDQLFNETDSAISQAAYETHPEPPYAVMSWLFIRAANARFLVRDVQQTDRPCDDPPFIREEESHREQFSGRHRRDHYDYPLKRPR